MRVEGAPPGGGLWGVLLESLSCDLDNWIPSLLWCIWGRIFESVVVGEEMGVLEGFTHGKEVW